MSKTYKDQKAYRGKMRSKMANGEINTPDGGWTKMNPSSKMEVMSVSGARKRNPSRSNHTHRPETKKA